MDNTTIGLYSMWGTIVQAVVAVIMIIATGYIAYSQNNLLKKQNSIVLLDKRIKLEEDIINLCKEIINLSDKTENAPFERREYINQYLNETHDITRKIKLKQERIRYLFDNKDNKKDLNNSIDAIYKCMKNISESYSKYISDYPTAENHIKKDEAKKQYNSDKFEQIEKITKLMEKVHDEFIKGTKQ